MPSTSYTPAASSYPYGYGSVTSPQSASHGAPPMNSQVGGQILPLPVAPAHGYVTASSGSGQGSSPFDTTGQIPPPGIKPRVTATLWEDEGSLCFQVEARGICVARRDDNDMINGTKLLNVAGMTRGRRDGILKSEKLRHVIKIGPMHLKGVWIPYDRALEFANKEKITDLLYPLFVHNIGSLLMHPQNPSRANALIAASERRRLESRTPAINHHSMGAPQQLSAPLTHHRHESGRSHTFPTPPGSSASVLNGHGNGYEWASGVQSQQPLSIDTSMAAARSLPATPATTPPGPAVHGIPSYQNPSSYDAKPYYAAATTTAPHYSTHASMAHPQDLSHSSHADGDSHQEGHSEYINGPAYASSRASYPYSATAPVAAMTADTAQVSSAVNDSGPTDSRSDRIHSRHGSQSHWPYPSRTGASSNVYRF
ncbi:hypothetical protein KEM54_003433 [Ascosphaera aggregata]|nr:hypothetical protein KEM54_003433 [Ascosphaera aggregata]